MNSFTRAVIETMRREPRHTFCTMIDRHGESTLRWSDFETDCRRFMRLYLNRGLQPKDVIFLFLEFSPKMYGAFIGALLCGLVPSFMPTLNSRQSAGIFWGSHLELLRTVKPAALVASAETFIQMSGAGIELEFAQSIPIEELEEPDGRDFYGAAEDNVAVLQHSSGTTGLKKGVALSFRAIVSQLDSYAEAISLQRGDEIVSWLPLYHDMGLVACFLMPLYRSIPMVHIDPLHWVARPNTLCQALDGRENALVWMPNFAFEHMSVTLRKDAGTYDLSRVKAFINCSEPCRGQSFDRFLNVFQPAGVRAEQLQCCYAMAETTFAVTQSDVGTAVRRLRVDSRRFAIGQSPVDPTSRYEVVESGAPLKGVNLEIVNDAGTRVPDGTVGEISLSAPFLFNEYNKDPDRTHRRLRGGRYFSNDLGFIHQGRVFVLGRRDDVIIVNGRNLFAHEIEAALVGVGGVRPGRLAAVAVQNERIGSADLVIIAERDAEVHRSDVDIQGEILSVVYSTFTVQPRAVVLRDSGFLVKTTSGKINRSLSLERYTESLVHV